VTWRWLLSGRLVTVGPKDMQRSRWLTQHRVCSRSLVVLPAYDFSTRLDRRWTSPGHRIACPARRVLHPSPQCVSLPSLASSSCYWTISSSLEQLGVRSRSEKIDDFGVDSINQYPVGSDVAISKAFQIARKGVVSMAGSQRATDANRFDRGLEPIDVLPAFRESLQIALATRAGSNPSFRLPAVSRHALKP
jgi:hypothetical protein